MCVSLTSQSSPHFFSAPNAGTAPASTDVTQPVSAAESSRPAEDDQRGEGGRDWRLEQMQKHEAQKNTPLPSSDGEEDTVPARPWVWRWMSHCLAHMGGNNQTNKQEITFVQLSTANYHDMLVLPAAARCFYSGMLSVLIQEALTLRWLWHYGGLFSHVINNIQAELWCLTLVLVLWM